MILNLKNYMELIYYRPGFLGGYGDIILDNIQKPKKIFGVCDGRGDFLRNLSEKQKNKIKKNSFKSKN